MRDLALSAGLSEPIRRAHETDASRLFEIRRTAILAFAPPLMPPEQATAWADRHPIEWMSEFLRKRDVWVYQPDGNAIRGWIGLTANIVDGLYTCPEYARRGVASRLLLYVEAELQRRGFRDVRLEASVNAEQFYARRGYVIAGPRPADGAVPMSKTFPSAPA